MKNLFNLFIVFIVGLTNVYAQSTWSKIWDCGNTEITNRIKSSHLVNDTLYYVTFNVCDFDGQSWNECNTLGMMDAEGTIINEKLVDNLSILEGGNIPWIIEDDKIILLDGKGIWDKPTMDIKIYDRYSLDSIATYTYMVRDSIDFNFGSGIESFGDFYVMSGWCRITDTDTWPDFMVWIDKQTMEIDSIMEYPFAKESVIPEFLFLDGDSALSVYFSGIDIRGNSNSRGFMTYNEDKEMTFFYLDTIDYRTSHRYTHTATIKKNGDKIYKQEYDANEQSWPITWNSDFDILCIDSGGEIKWRFNNPGWSYTATVELQFTGSKDVYNVSVTEDGDILACGTTFWHSNYPTIFEYNWLEDTLPPFPDSLHTYEAPYILKLDGDTGELLWQYSIIDYDEYGNIGPYALRQLHELSDGSIIGTGWSQTYDENGNHIKDDSWVIRLPSDGCVEDGNMECGFENYIATSTDDLVLVNMKNDKPFVFYPNPSNGLYNIMNLHNYHEKVWFTITDIHGNLIKNEKGVFLESIDLRDYNTNVFIIKIYDKKGKVLQIETLVKI